MKHHTKITAHDVESIHFISSLLQDSITCKLWIIYRDKQVKLLVNRVCWETPSSDLEHHRILSIITIEDVESAKMTKSSDKIEFFSFVSINCDKKNHIRINFSNGSLITKVNSLSVRIKDITQQWNSQHMFKKNNIA